MQLESLLAWTVTISDIALVPVLSATTMLLLMDNIGLKP